MLTRRFRIELFRPYRLAFDKLLGSTRMSLLKFMFYNMFSANRLFLACTYRKKAVTLWTF